jgi:hypothetical protein
MAPAVVQSAARVWAASPQSLAFGSSVTAGNLLVAFVFRDTPNWPTCTVSDSRGSTWHYATNNFNTSASVQLFWAVAASSGADTVTVSTSTDNNGFLIYEVSGLSATTPQDVIAAPFNTTTSAVLKGNDLSGLASTTDWVAYWAGYGPASASTPGAPWTADQRVTFSGSALTCLAYQTASGTAVTGPTFRGGAAAVGGVVGIAFQPTAATILSTACTVALGPLTTTAATSTVSVGGCGRGAWLVLGAQAVNLEDAAQGYFCSSLDIGFPAVREVVSNNPDRDGVADRTQYMGSRVVSANITAVAGAGATIDKAATLFAPFMAPSARPVLHYVLDRPGNPERTLTLRAAGYSWPVAGPAQRDILLQWVAADPVARDPTVRTVTATTIATATIASAGDMPVRPLLRVTGPITGATITLTPTAGPVWTIAFVATYTLPAGHFIAIDTDARTVLLDGDPAAPRLAYLDWARTSWQWTPPQPSTSTLALSGAATTAATQVTATWQDGYLS